MSDRLMTLDDLCARLQCKKSWARAQLEARRWPITWVAKSYRFTEDDYRKILQILPSESPAEPTKPTATTRVRRSASARAKRPITG